MSRDNNKWPHIMRVCFGILMILIYLGMGVLMLMNFFRWSQPGIAYGLGALFIIYGIYRGIRQFKGLDYN